MQQSELPDTIRHKDAFMRNLPPSFDGVAHFDWMQACWDNPRDKPMDYDMVKERNGQFLLIETKEPGRNVPLGQVIAFERAHALGNTAIMFAWGKRAPEYGTFWFPNTTAAVHFQGVQQAQDLVRRWFRWADRKPRPARRNMPVEHPDFA